MDPLGMIMASKAVEDHWDGARLDRPTRPPRRSFIDPVRVRAARLLRRLADRLEPPMRECPARRTVAQS